MMSEVFRVHRVTFPSFHDGLIDCLHAKRAIDCSRERHELEGKILRTLFIANQLETAQTVCRKLKCSSLLQSDACMCRRSESRSARVRCATGREAIADPKRKREKRETCYSRALLSKWLRLPVTTISCRRSVASAGEERNSRTGDRKQGRASKGESSNHATPSKNRHTCSYGYSFCCPLSCHLLRRTRSQSGRTGGQSDCCSAHLLLVCTECVSR